MDRDKIDLGAGLFIILAVISLIFIALRAANLTNVNIATTYSLAVSFENIGGLKERSPVKSSGIVVGRITSLNLDQDNYEAIALLDIDSSFTFPEDSTFSVVSTNLLGDQYINIEAGGADKMLSDGDITVGNSAIILEDLISKFLFDEAAE